MRHRVVHDYLNVDEDVVWHTLTHELVGLITELENMLPSEDTTEASQT